MPKLLQRSNCTFLLKIQHPFSVKLFATVLLLITAINCFAQTPKPPYNLLWRISGKGLKQPSYLFGTMHVKKSRVFHFSDSVMLAIKKCDAFALEVHPDTIMQKMFSMLSREDTTRDLHKLLKKDEYDQLKQRFKERNGYEMRDSDPMFIESMMTDESKSEDDKPAFVDAHLYGIAHTMAKKIYGLENAGDQFNAIYGNSDDMRERLLALLDIDTKEQRDQQDDLVKIYSAGNIEQIANYLTIEALNDPDLIARNKVMSAGIIKQMDVQSMFTAVGVAHLPGETGVIALLKKAGYTLTPVAATFTGVSETFHIDYLKMPWQKYTDTDLGYSLSMPGTPIKTEAIMGIKTIVYPDMSNGAYFGAYAIVRGTASNPVKADEMINSILNNFKAGKKQKVISRKDLIINGLPCTDVVLKNTTGYMRMNLYVQNNTVYALYVGNQLQNINQPYANRFFKSFRCFKAAPKAPQSWTSYRDEKAAFKISLPDKPADMLKDAPNTIQKNGDPIKMSIIYAVDTINLVNYIVRYNDYPAGTYLASPASLFDGLEKEFNGKGKILSPAVKVYKDGLEGREVKVMLMDKYYTTIQLYPRGNRVYLLMRQSLAEKAKSQTDDAFFSSFSFLPFKDAPVYIYQPEGLNFKVQLPVKPKTTIDSTGRTSYIVNAVTNFATNPNSGGVYGFEYSYISPYYRAVSVDSLYNKLIKRLVNYTDSLVKLDTVDMSGLKGRELVTVKKGTTNKSRNRILINNGVVYLFSSHVASEELFNNSSNTFFNSLAISPGDKTVDILSSKAELISKALLSKDTTAYKEGLSALDYYTFNKDEMPVVYTLLNHQFADDTTTDGARVNLLESFTKIEDANNLPFLTKLYAAADGKDVVKAAILSTMPKADKQKGFEQYVNLLTTTKPVKVENEWKIFRPLRDSIPYVAANFNRILPLVNAPEYRYRILSLADDLAGDDDKPEYKAIVQSNIAALTAHAQHDLDDYLVHLKDTTQDYDRELMVSQYLDLMKAIKGQPITNGFTNKVLSSKNDLLAEALITRIHNHLPTNKLLVNRLLDSLKWRHDILNALNKEKQLATVPAKYTRPDEFARLCVYHYLSDQEDEGYPDTINLLGSITDKGQIYYAYKFTMSAMEEGKTFIAIAGPYKPGSTKLDFKNYNSYTGWDAKKTNWQAQARKMIPKLIEYNKN